MIQLNVQKPRTPSESDEVYDVEVKLVKRAMLLKSRLVAIQNPQDISK